jgi:hypothetical protein
MPFIPNTKPAILNILAVAFVVTLVAFAGTSLARPSPAPNHAESSPLANPPQDSTCQAVLDAGDKLFSVPYHAYTTITVDGKPMAGESIAVGGVIYVMINGKWSNSTMSVADMKQLNETNKKKIHNVSCKFVRDESVNGESAALYTTHEETDHGKNDNQVWISKSKGLIIKQETDIDIGNGRPKSHMSGRYEYNNVQAPPLTK